MTLSQRLRKEIQQTPDGTYSPAYFKFLGYRDHLDAPIALLRAYGIASLFTLPTPVIYRHDRIVGNTRCLYTDAAETAIKYAERFTSQIGERGFLTNKDHFAPDYEHAIAVGIPGLIGEIDQSLEKYKQDAERCEALQAMRITLTAFLEMIRKYAAQAENCVGKDGYDETRLSFIRETCASLLEGAPKSFAAGLKLMWLIHTAFCMDSCCAMALGRMDQFLYPLYQQDIAAGRLTKEDAIELLLKTEGYAVSQRPTYKIDAGLLDKIRQAIKEQKRITAIYDGRKKTLSPYGIVYGSNVFLIAVEGNWTNPYVYRLHRLSDITLTEETFDKGDFDIKEYVNRSFGVYQNEIIKVELLFSKEVSEDVLNYNFHPTQKVKQNADGSVTVKFKASGELEIMWHLFKWGADVKIISPKYLRTQYIEYLENVIEKQKSK